MFECSAGVRAQLCGRPLTRAQGAGLSRQTTWAQLCGRPMTRSQDLRGGRLRAQLCGRLGRRLRAQLSGRPMTRAQGAGLSRQTTWAQLWGRPMTRSQGAGPSRQMTWAQLWGRPMTRSQGAPQAYAQAHIAATWKSVAWECSGVSSKPTLRLWRLTSMCGGSCQGGAAGVTSIRSGPYCSNVEVSSVGVQRRQ